jgi:hypothetical protein
MIVDFHEAASPDHLASMCMDQIRFTKLKFLKLDGAFIRKKDVLSIVNNCNLLKSLDICLPRALFDVSSKSIRKAVPKGIHLRIYPSDIVQRL